MPEETNNEKVQTLGLTEQLQQYLEKQVAGDSFSVVVLVAKGGEPIFEYASGFANVEAQTSNTTETKFNLGSINKIFTAVAIAQLVEQGKLDFDDPVGKALPEYPNQTVREQVTIRHLLTHTSGLGSFIDTQHREQFLAVKDSLKTIDDVVALFKDRPLPYQLGEYHYSSDGYEVLGAVIEAVSSQSYYDYVREHIFEVAGMSDTDSYEIDPQNPREDIAIGYTRRDPRSNQEAENEERIDNFGLNLLKGTAGGSGYSTAHDLLRFSQALLGNKLLSPEMTQEVLKAKVDLGSKGNQHKHQAYGFQVFDVDGTRRIGHPGRFAGVNTRFDMYPEQGYTVVVLANYDPPAAFDVAEKATELLT